MTSPRLELRGISLHAGASADDGEEELWLLRQVSAGFPRGHLCAVVGPSGSGKSTLLKAIAGIRSPAEGAVFWEGRDLEERDLDPNQIGYVPQFGISFDLLSVRENLEVALRLRVGGLGAEARAGRIAEILHQTGLDEIADRRGAVLSGGQKRRLALAVEMAAQPALLLCDEVTSGLDTKAEDEIVALMRGLAHDGTGRTVLSVTHSLRHLEMHDSVAVLMEGRLVYHGSPAGLTNYFSIQRPEELFDLLTGRDAGGWHASWEKRRDLYEGELSDDAPAPKKEEPETFLAPGWLTQFVVLLGRQRKLWLRDRGQLLLQLALLFGFPCLVVVFAWDGLPQIQNFTSTASQNVLEQVLASTSFSLQAARVGGLVSGLVMFQIVLLTLMGSNNAAREIAGQRAIFEKEKFAGLRPSAFLASKAAHLAAVVAAQSIWMALFVSTICHFPGDVLEQTAVLLGVNAAMTSVCLGISALARTADHASLVSVYLVGFQLPLSGAVLALPHLLGQVTRPFIAAYWGWSGYLETMRETRFYDVVTMTSQTALSAWEICLLVLAGHILAGLLLAWFGTRQSRWE